MFCFNKFGINFWLFRSGQIISLIGDQLAHIALSFFVLNKFGSASILSYIIIPATITNLFVSIILSPFADSLQRKPFIVYGNFFKAIIWLLFFGIFVFGDINIGILILLYIFNAFGTAIINAGASGFLPELVKKAQLQEAFQITTGTNSFIKIIGNLVSGSIVLLFGTTLAILSNMFSFICAGILTYKISNKTTANNNVNKLLTCLSSIWWKKNIYEVILYLANKKTIFYLCIVLFFFQLTIAPIQIVLPVLSTKVSNYAVFLGVLLSVEGLGAIIASLFVGILTNYFNKSKIIIFNLFLASVALLCLGLFSNILVYPVLVFIYGYGITQVSILINSFLLQEIPANYRSRFFTIIFFMESIAIPLGIAFAGYFIDHFGVYRMLNTIGVGLFLVTAFSYYKKIFHMIDNI